MTGFYISRIIFQVNVILVLTIWHLLCEGNSIGLKDLPPTWGLYNPREVAYSGEVFKYLPSLV